MDQPSLLDAPVTEQDVDGLFRAILRRPPDNPEHTRGLVARGTSARDLITALRACGELRVTMAREAEPHASPARRDPQWFRCPPDLAVTPTSPARVLIVGSCLMHIWAERIAAATPPGDSDVYLFGAELPPHPARPIGEYDFQLVNLPLRDILPDGAFARLRQDDADGHQALFDQCVARSRFQLQTSMRWNTDFAILTFVLPFVVPQQNLVGRLLPRYALHNPVYFVERLNEALAAELLQYSNAYLFDFNEVLATHGKRFVQEDMTAQFNHASLAEDFDWQHDTGRMDPAHHSYELYEARVGETIAAAWLELLANARTLRGTDAVKLVVVDADDTLWRGTIGETDAHAMPTAEGWPRALWEALLVLRRRGILLGLVSNNDEARLVQTAPAIFGRHLRLDDFTVRRIDWRGKPEKLAEVLAEVNLLAQNVVFIDDNPLQRAELRAAFPGLRVLGGDPITWRHILLWAPETQVAAITAESAARTDMMRGQLRREAQRTLQPRGEFLRSLDLRMTLFAIDHTTHPRFTRALELINKTNQFNTTGERWTHAQCTAAFDAGMRMHAFELADAYTEYGLVGVLVADADSIRQFVMSCRVMGLDAELAAVAHAVALFAARGASAISARMLATERNLPCRTLFERCGFTERAGVWHRSTAAPPPFPAHLALAPALL